MKARALLLGEEHGNRMTDQAWSRTLAVTFIASVTDFVRAPIPQLVRNPADGSHASYWY